MKYTGNALREISFPLGGIGTGSIGLMGNGHLMDWEIFNRADKGSLNGYTHIAVKETVNGESRYKVLQGDWDKDFTGTYNGIRDRESYFGYGYGPSGKTMCGFPHFEKCEFEGEFPIANIHFQDKEFSGEVSLTAFNPFIPLDSYNSSLPAAFFEITYRNTTDTDVEFESVFSLGNPFEKSMNIASKQDSHSFILLDYADMDKSQTAYGQLCLACEDATAVQSYWYRGRWQDGIVSFWNEFTSEEGLRPRNFDTAGSFDMCSMGKKIDVPAGESKTIRFVVSWYVPNNSNWWNSLPGYKDQTVGCWKNYYATQFAGAVEVADYCMKNWDDFYGRTLEYKEELFASTVDPVILDAVSATVSVIKSPTVYRLENGEFYGFEGVMEHVGSCQGTCQHVYNYAYAMCFLFPDLEQSIRNLEFEHCTFEDGSTKFRIDLPLQEPANPWRSCLDGQMGCVIKTYREWKISGNNDWLRKVWPTVKKVLEYAWSPANPDEWDLDKDGVLEGRQHHTLDMEMFGPSSWLQGFYLAALKAAAEMAEFLGDQVASEYLELFEKGQKWTDENLFNGKYYFHKVDLTDKEIVEHFDCVEDYWNEENGQIKYQVGEGSEIDQLCGQWHANICGLGRLFDKEQTHTALENMFKNNFKSSMRNFTNPWRIFALNDEAGSIICDYPEGAEKPKIPICYCEESMHGFEYQFAGLLISEGFVDEGLRVVKAVRDRYQGHNRNPWNEIECGNNYARSMASFALLPIISGFSFDLPHGKIGFNPIVKEDNFRCLWSLGTGWGNVQISGQETKITVRRGELKLNAVELPYLKQVETVKIDGVDVPFTFENGVLQFAECNVCHAIEVR